MQIGTKYHGFILDSIEPIEEMKMEAYRFTHERSGASLLWLSCSDTNRAFCISFKTLPENSTGVFHILEHSVLCGSRKFPLREPFVDLLKGSLQTFLNAMTFPDKTMYPVASTNERDFVNLMDVYMDAVLYPRIYSCEEIFMQEGWHLIPAEGDTAPAISGVVYNEMKGSYSSPDSILYHTLQSEMLPDTCYTYSSGGDPVNIPDLTYDEFIATHRKYYHPENSYIYLYGEMDIEEKLKFLDEKYLSTFEKSGNTFDISWQKPFGQRIVHAYYEIGEGEDVAHNAMLAKSVALCDYNQRSTLIGMRILLSALTSSNEAPLTHAIMEAKLGDDFSAWVDDGIQQPYVTFRLKKADADQMERFTAVLNDTLAKLAKEGIDRTLLDASLNRFEFDMREMDFGMAPGVALAVNVMETWLYGGDPLDMLKTRHILEKLRKEMENGYFEKLIERHLLSPAHSVALTLEPSRTIAGERLDVERARAASCEKALDKEGMDAYLEKLKRFETFQTTEDSKDAKDSLPHLERSDLDEGISHTACRIEKIGNTEMHLYPLASNGISYLRLYYDVSSLAREDWGYLSLLSDVLFDCPTEQYDALTYQSCIMSNLGLLTAALDDITEVEGEKNFRPFFTIIASYLEEKTSVAKRLIEEGILRTVFNQEHLKKLLKQLLVAKEGELIRSGHTMAARRAGSGVSLSRAFADETSGYGYYCFLKDLCGDIDARLPAIAEKLKNLLSQVIDADTETVSLVASDTYLNEYVRNPIVVASMGGKSRQKIPFTPHVVSEGIKIPGAVAYNALVGNYDTAGFAYNGVMTVLSRIVSLEYLWTRVRMRGGAYGCNCSIETMGGVFALASYRDPHVGTTYDTYRDLPSFLRDFAVDESEMTKFVIGAFSVLDQPKRVWAEAHINDVRMFAGITDERRQINRSATLHTTAEDIRKIADTVEAVLASASMCTIGAADKIEAAANLFNHIKS